MKIAFLIPSFSQSGGIERVSSIIANNLLEKNEHYEITLIGYYNKEEQPFFYCNPKIKLKTIFRDPTPMSKGIFRAIHYMRKDISENKYDILIVCGSLNFPLGVLSKIGKKTKLILWEHSQYTINNQVKFQKYTRKYWGEFADAIVTLTDQDAIVYKENIKRTNIYRIYNPLDPSLSTPKNSLNENKKLLISVGRLVEEKNFLKAIEVANIVLKKNPDWKWHIYGEGNQRLAIENKISQYSLNDQVILMGNDNEIYSKYRQYSLLISTSKNEGFGLVLVEAMYNKLPVISFDVPNGPKEIIDHNISGYLVKYNDIEEMGIRICELIKDEGKRQIFADNSFNTVQKFKIDNIINEWENLFNQIL